MTRFLLTIEYDGGPFVGWQRQNNGMSVQETVETAIEKFSGEKTLVYAAGRTDAGVHALAMPAHVDIERPMSGYALCAAINHHMKPAPVSIIDAVEVDKEFHARFSCLERAYEYRIINRHAPLALEHGRAWRVPGALDADAMHEAAQALVGSHDFTTFRAVTCQSASPLKSLDRISVSRVGELIVMRCAARSFLQHQVRSFAGSLVEVGRGRWTKRDLVDALKAASRDRCGPVAPPTGLYFSKARYDINS